ncbi:septum formation initiator family protein [Kingella sp. SNUBH-2017]|uniref:Cell division protein FtsB n=1 Tax=Kingella pumchi TaxID=2779506 RepID=A0ABS9NM29_9NEIS|nr:MULTISPECIES: septum formation initiator family protein [Kingella]MCG6503735.1 septum formation initiator family protein [Kingella pumchi]MDD2183732.1 septum formation initiator family protein [Kingella sp. SNUBH-2017]
MKYITFILLAILGGLHFQIWKPGGLRAQYAEASAQAADFASRNEGARINNNILRAEVEDLKNGYEAVTELARFQLGYIRDGEIYYDLSHGEEP